MTAATTESGTVEITVPGVYDDLPEHVYHADPVPAGSLSSSGARLLLPPSCPARFRYAADHPDPPSRDLDLGTAAHQLVLGVGPDLVVVDAPNWRTKDAREQRKDAHAAGAVPLLTHEHDQVQAMAAALRRHPVAAALFQPGTGRPEQSLFWVDADTGVWRRARLDWLRHPGRGRLILADYKTARSADPLSLPRSINEYGYHMQAAWYLDAVQALGLADDSAVFVFAVQEKTPPYLVTVVELDATALRIGRRRNREAIDIYRHCVESGEWPGYSDDVALLSLPAWVERQELEETA